MTDHPDSALTLLEGISSHRALSHADNALYALLLTQARHKNFIPLVNDSLIRVAVNYYGDKEKSLRAAQAHYYLGATYRDLEQIPFAVEEYLKAIQLMPEEDQFLAIMYDNLAECNENEGLYEEAMEAYRKAYQILKDDKRQVYYPLRGIAHVFLAQSQLDSALHYYQRTLDNTIEILQGYIWGNVVPDLRSRGYSPDKYPLNENNLGIGLFDILIELTKDC